VVAAVAVVAVCGGVVCVVVVCGVVVVGGVVVGVVAGGVVAGGVVAGVDVLAFCRSISLFLIYCISFLCLVIPLSIPVSGRVIVNTRMTVPSKIPNGLSFRLLLK